MGNGDIACVDRRNRRNCRTVAALLIKPGVAPQASPYCRRFAGPQEIADLFRLVKCFADPQAQAIMSVRGIGGKERILFYRQELALIAVGGKISLDVFAAGVDKRNFRLPSAVAGDVGKIVPVRGIVSVRRCGYGFFQGPGAGFASAESVVAGSGNKAVGSEPPRMVVARGNPPEIGVREFAALAMAVAADDHHGAIGFY